MTWKDIIKSAKEDKDEIERILNYHVSGEDDYSREKAKELESILNQSFDDKIEVEYVPDDSAYYIDVYDGSRMRNRKGQGKTYRFDKDGKFKGLVYMTKRD